MKLFYNFTAYGLKDGRVYVGKKDTGTPGWNGRKWVIGGETFSEIFMMYAGNSVVVFPACMYPHDIELSVPDEIVRIKKKKQYRRAKWEQKLLNEYNLFLYRKKIGERALTRFEWNDMVANSLKRN